MAKQRRKRGTAGIALLATGASERDRPVAACARGSSPGGLSCFFRCLCQRLWPGAQRRRKELGQGSARPVSPSHWSPRGAADGKLDLRLRHGRCRPRTLCHQPVQYLGDWRCRTQRRHFAAGGPRRSPGPHRAGHGLRSQLRPGRPGHRRRRHAAPVQAGQYWPGHADRRQPNCPEV